MPGLADMMRDAIASGVKSGGESANNQQQLAIQLANQQALSTQKAKQDMEAEEKKLNLEHFLKGASRDQANQMVQNFIDQEAGKGRNAHFTVTPEGVSGALAQPDPSLKLAGQVGSQGRAFQSVVNKAYKPLSDQVDASKNTLDYLNLNTSAGDKLALINEARLGGGSSRAVASLLQTITGKSTAGMKLQDLENFINNTPEVSTMTPASRDALRETVFARIPQMQKAHEQLGTQMSQQGAAAFPMASSSAILSPVHQNIKSNIDTLSGMQQDYQKQRQQQGGKVGTGFTTADKPTSLWGLLTGRSSSRSPSSTSAKPQTVMQGGHTYNLNPQTGEYE